MKTILYATDLSANSFSVGLYAYRLTQTLKAKLLLCHAVNVPAEVPQSGIMAWPQEVYDDMDHDSKSELAKLKHQLTAAGDPDLDIPEIVCAQGAGLVTDVVNAEAVRCQANLVIMGTHANDRLGTWLIGNHTRKLIETAVCPVLVVPVATEFKAIKRIGFGSDFKHPELEIQAIDQLVKLSKIWKAELILAHIETDTQSLGDNSVIKNVLVELMRDHGHQQVSVKVVKSQHVSSGLDWLVRHAHIDLLAMVHHQHGFLDDLLHGSNTQRVATHIPVPLMIFNS